MRIDRDFREPFNIKTLATEFNLSREHLTRRFRERFGECPGARLRKRRTEIAAELDRTTSLPAAEIARLCGWDDARTLKRALSSPSG